MKITLTFQIGDEVQIIPFHVSTVEALFSDLHGDTVYVIEQIETDGTYYFLRFKGQTAFANSLFFNEVKKKTGFVLDEIV